ncbi:MAG: hypothetical protein IOMNBAOH_02018 [Rhodocyclaceae bacterium]|jgi:ribonuclease T1|nr:hypothetical protein [Rhodocyclaceae bacterium]
MQDPTARAQVSRRWRGVRALALALFSAVCCGVASAESRTLPAGSPTSRAYPIVSEAQLPPAARQTLSRIRQGGPFPYRKDGSVFHNREGRLPVKFRGYYREYTVAEHGARDRGPRRIVVGGPDPADTQIRQEFYYSPDHYRSFQRILP